MREFGGERVDEKPEKGKRRASLKNKLQTKLYLCLLFVPVFKPYTRGKQEYVWALTVS